MRIGANMIANPRPFFLPGRLAFDRGTAADYRHLERFHYVPARPATFAGVAVCRFVPDAGPARVVGVAVLSWPSALNRTRHRVFGLRPMRFGNRLRWVNANVRTVSRVIVHPQFRSLGLSTQLIEQAVAMCPTPFVEASARMGRAHPLFERAGFTRVEPETPAEPLYFWRETSGSLSRVLAGEG
jgi:GNAT superfamily N-acetyltransferase